MTGLNRNGEVIKTKKRPPAIWGVQVPCKMWREFDPWAERLVRKEIDFDTFAKADAVRLGVKAMAYEATKRRPTPKWMDLSDVQSLILGYLWYYAFEHRSRPVHVVDVQGNPLDGPPTEGVIGYSAERHDSAGAFLRWNAMQHTQKALGKARGENMHAHRIFEPAPDSDGKPRITNRLPERLSTTGDFDAVQMDTQDGPANVEVALDDHQRRAALARITQATKDFVIQAEVAKTFRKTNKAAKKVKVREFLIKSEGARADLKRLGIQRSLKCETADCLLEFIVRGLGGAGAASSSEAKKSEDEEAPDFGAHPKK